MNRSSRRRIGDWMIRAGLFLQVVFLVLVDWGSISGMTDEETVPWGHVFGLVAVNVMLFCAAYFAWVWMKRAQAEAGADRHGG